MSRTDHTLRELQVNLPWTIRYSRDFRANPQPHKDFAHALTHIGKAAGQLHAFVDDMDHRRDEAEAPDVREKYAKYIADMVVCALRLANTFPGGPIDLQAAVKERLEGKNGVRLPPPSQGIPDACIPAFLDLPLEQRAQLAELCETTISKIPVMPPGVKLDLRPLGTFNKQDVLTACAAFMESRRAAHAEHGAGGRKVTWPGTAHMRKAIEAAGFLFIDPEGQDGLLSTEDAEISRRFGAPITTGRGLMEQGGPTSSICPTCHGNGYTDGEICQVCSASGEVNHAEVAP